MDTKARMEELAKNIEKYAFRKGSVSAFTLASFPGESDRHLAIHITRECEGLIYGNAEVGSLDALAACIEALDGRVDYIVYDTGLFQKVLHPDKMKELAPKKSILLPYSDMGVWVESVRWTLLAVVPDIILKKIVLVTSGENDSLAKRILMDLSWYCHDLWVSNIDETGELDKSKQKEIFSKTDILIGGAIYRQVITPEIIKLTNANPLILDAGIGTLSLEAADYARSKGIRMIRVDNRAAMAGALFSVIQSHDLVTRVMGEGLIDNIKVVAGGIVGEPGTVIVDSIDAPVQVIGIADGTGKVRYEPANNEEREKLERVKTIVEKDEKR